MNEKRFTIIINSDDTSTFDIIDNQEDKVYNFVNDVVSLNQGKEVVGVLNTLHQENQQLKHYKLYEDNKRLQTILADLKEENEQLKWQCKRLKEMIE